LDRVILALKNFIVGTPFALELVAIKPVFRKLVSKSLESFLSAGTEFDERAPCLGFLVEVLYKGNKSNRCRGRRRGRSTKSLAAKSAPDSP
jgi:hypothetical protein